MAHHDTWLCCGIWSLLVGHSGLWQADWQAGLSGHGLNGSNRQSSRMILVLDSIQHAEGTDTGISPSPGNLTVGRRNLTGCFRDWDSPSKLKTLVAHRLHRPHRPWIFLKNAPVGASRYVAEWPTYNGILPPGTAMSVWPQRIAGATSFRRIMCQGCWSAAALEHPPKALLSNPRGRR